MAEHGTVNTPTAEGNDYAGARADIRDFVHFTFVGYCCDNIVIGLACRSSSSSVLMGIFLILNWRASGAVHRRSAVPVLRSALLLLPDRVQA